MTRRRRIVIPIAAALVAAGCAAPSGLVPGHDLRVELHPALSGPGADRAVLALVAPYDVTSISHLVVRLVAVSALNGTETTVQSSDLTADQLRRAMVRFGALQPYTRYRARATAYASTGTADPISNDAASFVEFSTTNDDAPTIATLPVWLSDRAFGAAGTLPGARITKGAQTAYASSAALGAFGYAGPRAVAVAPSGTAYVADTNNGRVVAITPDGVASVFLANDGSAHAPGTVTGLAVGPGGTLYGVDDGLGRLFKATPAGVVSELGSSHGVKALAIDAAGALYGASGVEVFKFATDGSATVLAGSATSGYADAQGAAAAFDGLSAIAIDPSGNVLVADTNNHRLRKISPTGLVTTLAGSGAAATTDGQGPGASFNTPKGLAFDLAGLLYVSEAGGALRRVSPDGTVFTLSTGLGTAMQGLAVDSAGALLMITDAATLKKVQ